MVPADNDVSRAISVVPSSLTLAAGARGIATARFVIPRDTREGEQYAVIYAQAEGTDADGVVTRSRAGIRVYLDVGVGGEQPSDFRIASLQAGRSATGAAVVTAEVVNTGARALDLRGELVLRDGPGQLSAGPFPVTAGTTVGVGQTEQVRIALPRQVTGGPWTAALTLTSGLLTRSATAVLTFPEATGTAPAVAASPTSERPLAADHRIVVPLAVGLLGLVALLLIVTGYLTSRRRARGRS